MKNGNAPTLSLCMIVKDEEENIGEVLKICKNFADEIIVVDTGSKDRTVEIAKEMGAKVFFFEWIDDFSAARNKSLEHATGEWIMWIDADDRIDEFNIEKIKEFKKKLPSTKDEAYYFTVKSKNPNGDVYYWVHLRLFPNLPGVKFEGRIHEQVIWSLQRLGIKEKFLNIEIMHKGYEKSENMKSKLERNKRILLQEEERNPNSFFIKMYIAKLYETLGDIEEAIKKTEEAIELANSPLWLWHLNMSAAKLLEMKGEKERAMEKIDMAEKFNPTDGYTNLQRAELLFSMGKIEDAIEELEKAHSKGFVIGGILPISIEDIRRRADMLEARINYKLGNYIKAIEFFSKVKEHNLETFIEYINSLSKVGAYDKIYQSLYGKENLPPQLMLALAISAELLGKKEEAEKYYEEAYKNGKESPEISYTYSQFFFMKGDFQKSIDGIINFLQNPPQDMIEEIIYSLIALAHILLNFEKIEEFLNTTQTLTKIVEEKTDWKDIEDVAKTWLDISRKVDNKYMKAISIQNSLLTLQYSQNEEKSSEIIKEAEEIANEIGIGKIK